MLKQCPAGNEMDFVMFQGILYEDKTDVPCVLVL